MSRVGKKPIPVPDKVQVSVDGSRVTVKGPKGEDTVEVRDPAIRVVVESNVVTVHVTDPESAQQNANSGLYRALIASVVEGVTKGYQIRLELQGVGFRVQKQGDSLVFALGYSHPVNVLPPEGVEFAVDGQNKVIVSGLNKRAVGQVAANIKRLRSPDAYKGKGIRYEGEHIPLKQGKGVK
ncbi:MAG: 50S ribosomal protein L6 [Candidatus Margulisiibacteriota bacterium]